MQRLSPMQFVFLRIIARGTVRLEHCTRFYMNTIRSLLKRELLLVFRNLDDDRIVRLTLAGRSAVDGYQSRTLPKRRVDNGFSDAVVKMIAAKTTRKERNCA